TVSFTDPGTDTHDLWIDWGDGSIQHEKIDRKGTAPYSNTFSHYYAGPPDPLNPTDDIRIMVQVLDDDANVSGVMEDGFSQVREVTIKNPGTNANPDLLTFPVPLERGGMLLPQRDEQVPTMTVTTTPTPQSKVPDVRSGGGD